MLIYFRQMEDITVDDENFTEEENFASEINNQSASNKKLDLTMCNLHPKIVLERLSVPQLLNSNSPIRALDSLNSPTYSNSILCSPSQPGPSTSTPTCFSFESNGTVGRASKVRRLSSFFQSESELFDHEIRERNISQVQGDSESD